MTKQAVIDGVRPHHARTYENYVDHTFETDNNHWIPQSELLTYNGCYVPTKTYRFDDLADTWPFASELKKLNVSKRFQVDETYRRGEIDAKYKQDHKLWLSAEHLTL